MVSGLASFRPEGRRVKGEVPNQTLLTLLKDCFGSHIVPIKGTQSSLDEPQKDTYTTHKEHEAAH